LDKLIPAQISREQGRPGMHLWKILVLGTLRLNLNCDYDRIHDLANSHIKIRQMLGHGSFGNQPDYGLQTIKDNVSLFTPEILDQINQVVVKAGHQLVKKKRMKRSRVNVTPLSSKRMCISPPILTYCLTPVAKP
jgi:hypothetical protein